MGACFSSIAGNSGAAAASSVDPVHSGNFGHGVPPAEADAAAAAAAEPVVNIEQSILQEADTNQDGVVTGAELEAWATTHHRRISDFSEFSRDRSGWTPGAK